MEPLKPITKQVKSKYFKDKTLLSHCQRQTSAGTFVQPLLLGDGGSGFPPFPELLLQREAGPDRLQRRQSPGETLEKYSCLCSPLSAPLQTRAVNNPAAWRRSRGGCMRRCAGRAAGTAPGVPSVPLRGSAQPRHPREARCLASPSALRCCCTVMLRSLARVQAQHPLLRPRPMLTLSLCLFPPLQWTKRWAPQTHDD